MKATAVCVSVPQPSANTYIFAVIDSLCVMVLNLCKASFSEMVLELEATVLVTVLKFTSTIGQREAHSKNEMCHISNYLSHRF